ncbi:hypothetical protein [Streptomyces sp. CBMA123]|uniref:hypothetical protein n=1 Tax=Streptomyces sp. CBMA123 TaxID=1896313 RepID=UPI001661D7E3|nr:hypothetical protein [Streptomyces sp. CBMA123]MBD0689691.1 hypothetical protein [Streptomyces sp. CBMA123]
MEMDRLWEHVRDRHAQLKQASNNAPDFMNLLLFYMQESMGEAALNTLKLRKMRPGRKGSATEGLQSALVSVIEMAMVALVESTEDAPEVLRSELRL